MLLLVGLMLQPIAAFADEFSPALLKITEREGGWVDVTWKVPLRGDKVLALQPALPEFFKPLGSGSERRLPGGWLTFNSYNTGGRDLTGSVLKIEGLSSVPTDVLVRVELRDGTEHSAILRGGESSFTIPEKLTRTQLAISYWKLGTVHILEGFDHLLFLLTLLLIVSGVWPLLKTVTAFTLAHSLTLALATLGLVKIPSAPTEAVIALSIVLLAVEAVRKSTGVFTMSERFPWLIAFTFGLVHGLGFAGALFEIGVPQNEVPLALLMFNIGVETGQVMFVLAVSLILAVLHKFSSKVTSNIERIAPYAIGSIASFWMIERIVAFT